MQFVSESFRLADEILEGRSAWHELRAVIQTITSQEIISTHLALPKTPAGGQTAINKIFRDRLRPLGWKPEPLLYSSSKDLAAWKMDFIKERIGVEVSFNHAEAIPWTFTRLNLAGESENVIEEHRIDAGVAIFASKGLKSWAKMDSAVGPFELATTWLKLMRPIMPIPVLVIGLGAAQFPKTDVFRGTSTGTRRGATQKGTQITDWISEVEV